MKITLSRSQSVAKDKLMNSIMSGSETTLVGYAGTGKTTLVREIISDLKAARRSTVLLVPTGKAGVILSNITNHRVSTIHSAVYGAPTLDKKTGELKFRNPKIYCEQGDVVIVDEASMVGSKIYYDLKRKTPVGASILFVGDSFQLPPVNDKVGPSLGFPTAELTEVHRQGANSVVLQYATSLRRNEESEFYGNYDFSSPELKKYKQANAIDWMSHQHSAKNDHIMMCFTNKTRKSLNSKMREVLGFGGTDISIGEKIVVKSNNQTLGLCNGEVLTVSGIEFILWRGEACNLLSFEETSTKGKTLLSSIGATSSEFWEWKKSERIAMNNNWLHIDYGYALTVHSAQGSQWDRAGFVWDGAFGSYRRRNAFEARRLLYTAVTRACSRFAIFG